MFQPNTFKQHFSTGELTQNTYKLLGTKSHIAILDLLPIEQNTLESERQLAEIYQIYYENLPISGAKDVTFENAEKVKSFFLNHYNDTIVIHCRSANRNGAMMALAAFAFDDKNVDQAVSIGKNWGLKGLEDTVRAVINRSLIN
ncbi:hypothetical protein SOPP22_19250 [Shewanella sp. OPT22]|nr:hypothetical protein SOPP22_19250 [Shewanella sp. OPT22]